MREQQILLKRLKAFRKVDGMLVFRRFGYTESTNGAHMVTIMKGALFVSCFMSEKLVPTAKEILDGLLDATEKNGVIPTMLAVDDKHTAEAVNVVTERAGVHTGFYPPPSVEEQAFNVLMNGRTL